MQNWTKQNITLLARQDNTLFTLGPLLNGVGGIYTKYLCKTRYPTTYEVHAILQYSDGVQIYS